MNVSRLRIVWTVSFVTLAALVFALVIWLATIPADPVGESPARPTTQPQGPTPVLRIGLIPERDIFKQRRRYRMLADHLSGQLAGPVDLVTLQTYRGVLQEMEDRTIDGAFLGSMVTALAMDRAGVEVVAIPVLTGGISTYHGVIFVPQDSPIRTLEDLPSHSIGMVRTTTAGHMFPVCVMMQLGFLNQPNPPKIVWMGTHDEVAMKVMEGEIDVGAIKNLRLDALERSHPAWKIRRLAKGRCVPNNALCLRADVAERLGDKLSKILLNMHRNPPGRDALTAFGASHFVPCLPEAYTPVYDMAECVEPVWKQLGTSDPLPRRPPGWPKPDPTKLQRCYDVNY